MRIFVTIFITLIFMLLSHQSVAETRDTASTGAHSCKFETGDIGTVVGRGSTANEAFSAAVEECFDRRVSLYQRLRGQRVDMERGQLFIDACVNLSCQ